MTPPGLRLPASRPALLALRELLERELARIPLRRDRRPLAIERRRVVLRLDELGRPIAPTRPTIEELAASMRTTPEAVREGGERYRAYVLGNSPRGS